jgi:hypothetical protein
MRKCSRSEDNPQSAKYSRIRRDHNTYSPPGFAIFFREPENSSPTPESRPSPTGG